MYVDYSGTLSARRATMRLTRGQTHGSDPMSTSRSSGSCRGSARPTPTRCSPQGGSLGSPSADLVPTGRGSSAAERARHRARREWREERVAELRSRQWCQNGTLGRPFASGLRIRTRSRVRRYRCSISDGEAIHRRRSAATRAGGIRVRFEAKRHVLEEWGLIGVARKTCEYRRRGGDRARGGAGVDELGRADRAGGKQMRGGTG